MVFIFTQDNHEKPDYLVGGKWSLLGKYWKGYKIAKAMKHEKNILKYAKKINQIEEQLGLP